MALNPDWKEFIELLNSNGVEYLVVGAFALAFHGRPRLTGDIDFFVRNTPDNAARVLKTVQAFGFSSTGLTVADFTSDDQTVQLGFPPRRIDILTRISGVDFSEAWSRRIASRLGDLPVFFISLEDFVVNKRASGRDKDIVDANSVDPGL